MTTGNLSVRMVSSTLDLWFISILNTHVFVWCAILRETGNKGKQETCLCSNITASLHLKSNITNVHICLLKQFQLAAIILVWQNDWEHRETTNLSVTLHRYDLTLRKMLNKCFYNTWTIRLFQCSDIMSFSPTHLYVVIYMYDVRKAKQWTQEENKAQAYLREKHKPAFYYLFGSILPSNILGLSAVSHRAPYNTCTSFNKVYF